MTVYLGTLGRMIPIYSTPSAQLETEERYSFSTTLEGRRKAQVRPIGRRTWGLSAQFADPTEHSLLSQFANGAWGPGPFVFVPVDSVMTNLMTPDESLCIPTHTDSIVSAGGPVQLGSEGWSARSYQSADPGASPLLLSRTAVPVLPGKRVTGSAWVRGSGAYVRLHWYGEGDAYLGLSIGNATSTPSVMTRVQVTGTPPAGAVSCRLFSSSATQVTQPAVTWTDSLSEWGAGEGCPRAVVSAFSRDQVLAVQGNTYSNISFTVTEVG